MSRMIYCGFAALALAVSACTPVATSSASLSGATAPRPCFSTDQVRNFRATSDAVLYVRSSGAGQGTYEVTSTGGCAGLDLANSLSITSVAPTGSRVCVGDAVNLTTPGSAMMPGQCQGRITRVLTPSEIEALPTRSRP